MRTELYTDYETAKMLKELDFNEKCFGFFVQGGNETYILNLISSKNDGAVVASPTWQQAEVWLWEKHKIQIRIDDSSNPLNTKLKYCFTGFEKEKTEFNINNGGLDFDSPITAKNEGIKQAIKYLHSKINKR